MKPKVLLPLLLLACINLSPSAKSQPASTTTNSPASLAGGSLDPKELASLEKHAQPVLKNLNLNDASKEAKVHEILLAHFAGLKTWHEKHDAHLHELWGQFDKARAALDQPKADEILSEIDAVYAGFQPEHAHFAAALAPLLTPGQIEAIQDTLTVNKVKVTFNAYGEIFHGLTESQKAFILSQLKAAREEAIDAGSMQEKSAFFKKHKIKIEAYLTAQGYDVKQSYKEFVAKQKAETAARKAAASPAKPADGQTVP